MLSVCTCLGMGQPGGPNRSVWRPPPARHLCFTCKTLTSLLVLSPRYKQQLSAAEERQRGLEREKAQLALDWRQRCDVVERDHYRQAEDLIRALSEARDQVCVPRLVRCRRALGGPGSAPWLLDEGSGLSHVVVGIGRCRVSPSSVPCNDD